MEGSRTIRRLAKAVKEEIRIYRCVLRDPRTPWLPKAILGLAVAYLLSPIDIIPDCIPVLGHLDDIIIVPGLVWISLRFIPENVIRDARMATRDVVNPSADDA